MSLHLGAVGFIDALGFKGIWRRHDSDEVAATLKKGRSSALRAMKTALGFAYHYVMHRAGALPRISAQAFSDTFMFSLVVGEAREREPTLARAAAVVAYGISQMLRTMAQGPVPLTFRGAIAAGDCMIDPDNQIFIGPAVDEAAQLMDLANGAFTWLAPGTARLDYSWLKTSHLNPALVDYRVPLKNGSSILTKVVNPVALVSHKAPDFNQIRLNYSKAMESQLVDVEVKRQNTEALFDHLEQLSRTYMQGKKREYESKKPHQG